MAQNQEQSGGTHCASCTLDKVAHDMFPAKHPFLRAANDQPVDRALDSYGS
jgi:hypothetical protein